MPYPCPQRQTVTAKSAPLLRRSRCSPHLMRGVRCCESHAEGSQYRRPDQWRGIHVARRLVAIHHHGNSALRESRPRRLVGPLRKPHPGVASRIAGQCGASSWPISFTLSSLPLSLGAILLASWELFFLIKWLGAAYLIGSVSRCASSRGMPCATWRPISAPRAPAWWTFLHGLLAHVANPKAFCSLQRYGRSSATHRTTGPAIALLALTSLRPARPRGMPCSPARAQRGEVRPERSPIVNQCVRAPLLGWGRPCHAYATGAGVTEHL